jgi:hypothetical protein
MLCSIAPKLAKSDNSASNPRAMTNIPVVTLLLDCCYTVVTMVVQRYYNDVIMMVQRLYHGGTMVVQWCYNGGTKVLQWCYTVVTLLSHCYTYTT